MKHQYYNNGIKGKKVKTKKCKKEEEISVPVIRQCHCLQAKKSLKAKEEKTWITLKYESNKKWFKREKKFEWTQHYKKKNSKL